MPELVTFPGPVLIGGPIVGKAGLSMGEQTLRVRKTTAELNAGTTLLPALAGGRYRIVDFTMIAIGGNAATATSVRITGVQSSSTVQLATVAVAALTRGTNVKPNSANVTMLTDGAGTAVCDANTAITATVDNNNLATATAVDFIVTYAVETV